MIMSAAAQRLMERLRSRSARAGVLGLGYVGLPLAVQLARSGLRTCGIDLDPAKAAAINAGRSYIPDVRSEELEVLSRSCTLRATVRFEVIEQLDTVNICVPTPLRKTRDPDLSFVVSAVERVAEHLHPGMLIVLESTTYPGTTEEVVRPMLEATGMRVGEDFFLAFSPERVDPGNRTYNTRNVPKVVGGITESCGRLAAMLYEHAVDSVVPVSSTRAAEMVKLLENTFRAVNIGLVNELALMCAQMNLDVWEVIEAARTKPFGFMPFYPGPGLGGHCIPIDPFYLSWKARQSGVEARFIELAGEVNRAMPHAVVDLIADALNTRRKALCGSSVLVVGVTYKRDVHDVRESPAFDVMNLLTRKGARVAYHDPHVPALSAAAWAGPHLLESMPLTASTLREYDCVAILTDHSAIDLATIASAAELVVDTRNAMPPREGLFRLGAPPPTFDAAARGAAVAAG